MGEAGSVRLTYAEQDFQQGDTEPMKLRGQGEEGEGVSEVLCEGG